MDYQIKIVINLWCKFPIVKTAAYFIFTMFYFINIYLKSKHGIIYIHKPCIKNSKNLTLHRNA